jgi:GNAT superfamily N-acetyltransferase
VGLQVIPARSAYADYRRLHAATNAGELPAGASPGDWAASRCDLLDEARLDMFLGRLDRVPAGAAGVLTLGNQGVVTGLFTGPAHRRRGLARTLMGWVIEHCRRAQFEQVIADLPDEADGAASLLGTLGFAPSGSYVGFERTPARRN